MLPKGIEKRNYKGQIKFCPILAPRCQVLYLNKHKPFFVMSRGREAGGRKDNEFCGSTDSFSLEDEIHILVEILENIHIYTYEKGKFFHNLGQMRKRKIVYCFRDGWSLLYFSRMSEKMFLTRKRNLSKGLREWEGGRRRSRNLFSNGVGLTEVILLLYPA